MIIKNKKLLKSVVLYSLIVYFCCTFLNLSKLADLIINFEIIHDSLKYTALALIISCTLVRIISDGNRQLLAIYTVAGIISLVSFHATGSTIVGESSIILFSSMGIDIRQIGRKLFLTTVVLLSAMCFLVLLNIIPNNPIVGTSLLTGEQTIRRTLGFNHQNSLGNLLFVLILCTLLCERKKPSTLNYIGIVTVGLVLWVCGSRTSVILLSYIFILCILGAINGGVFKDRLFKMMIAVSAVSAILSVILPIIYSSDDAILVQINHALSDRLRMANVFFDDYGITLFGAQITFLPTAVAEQLGRGAMVLDNGYMHALIHYGIIPGIALLLPYYYVLYLAVKRRRYTIAIAVSAVLLSGVAENWLLTYGRALVPLCLLSMMTSRDEELSNE